MVTKWNVIPLTEISMSEGEINLVAIRNNEFVSKLVCINMVDIQAEKKSTVSLWITSFCYMVDEKKKKNNLFLARATVKVYAFSSCLCGFSPGTPVSCHILKMYTSGSMECLNCLSLSESGHKCECTLW